MNAATQKIDSYLSDLPVWQQAHLALFRDQIHAADPAVIEDWKWNVPVFVIENKITFAMSAFKAHTKYNFILNGALLEDRDGLFNNGFDSKKSRSIDLKEDESIDAAKLRTLIQAALSTL